MVKTWVSPEHMNLFLRILIHVLCTWKNDIRIWKTKTREFVSAVYWVQGFDIRSPSWAFMNEYLGTEYMYDGL